MKILKGLKPEKVFEFFEEISAIPRGSQDTEKVRKYCEDFAKSRKLRYGCDDGGNIVIFKSASAGRENEQPVIIQGHLDMVWEKDDTCRINFETDGLELAVDGDFVHAKGTTLGGDDGVAVAMGLALLDSDDVSHPPLEIVFTSDEERGMTGASALDTSVLQGKRMINLDSEAEGTLWVSCAGGVRADIELTVNYIDNSMPAYEINVSGLHGGHSGAEIHRGYANANKVMGRLLAELKNEIDFAVVDINGGAMDNAITRDSRCVIACEAENVVEAVKIIGKKLCDEIKENDPDAVISVSAFENAEKCMDKASTEKAVALLNELPSGVIAMSKEIDGLVETSLNIGVLKHSDGAVDYCFAVRSGKDGERQKLESVLKQIAEKYSCSITFSSPYPAWEYKKESDLRETMAQVYRDMFGKEMTVTAIHAGLECGLFCGKIKGLDCVSFGPDIYDIHTPQEKLSISSTERMWNYLLKVLESI